MQWCVNLAFGKQDVCTINKGVQVERRQITQYSSCVYSLCKVQTKGHPIFHKYICYNNNNNADLCKIPEQNEFNTNSLSY